MKKMMTFGIAVAGLLLCTGNVKAQSRVVREARTETRVRDDRYVNRNEPRPERERRHEVVAKPAPRGPKPVSPDAVAAFGRERYDSDRLRMAEMIFRTDGVMTAEQITRVSDMFSYDSNRIKFLTLAYDCCIDRYNYYMVLETLDYSSSREKIMDMVIKNTTARDRAAGIPNQNEIKTIVRMLKNQSFDSARLKLCRMIVAGNDFNARQIADMAKTFDFESNKTDFLSFAVRSCIDPQNYAVAINTLTFSSDRRKIEQLVMPRR